MKKISVILVLMICVFGISYCMLVAEKFCYDNNIGFGYPEDCNYCHEEIILCGKVFGEFVSGYMSDFEQECRCGNRLFARL